MAGNQDLPRLEATIVARSFISYVNFENSDQSKKFRGYKEADGAAKDGVVVLLMENSVVGGLLQCNLAPSVRFKKLRGF